jgi:hypothetical protein
MNGFIKRGLLTVLVTGGFLALGVGVAHADDTTDGSDGILSGTQALLGLDLPITVGGNAISVLGDSSSSGSSTSAGSGGGSSSSGSTSGNDSLLGGTQGILGVNAPVTIGGNAVSVIGDSTSEDSSFEGTSGSGEGGTATTSGKDGILGGTQIVGDVSAPITVSGNAISVAGDSFSGQSGTVSSGGSDAAGGPSGTTSGDDSIAGGTQVLADAGVPVVVGGNAISVIGDSSTEGSTVSNGSGGGSGAGDSATTDGSDSIAGGTQVVADAAAPVTAGGNAISIVGDSSTSGSDVSSPTTGGSPTASTSGEDSIVGGTQLVTGVNAPITLGNNAISVIGDSTVEDGTDGGDDGDVGGVTTTPPVTPGVALAGVGAVALLAETGSELLVPGLTLAVLLLAAGITFLIRPRTARS